MQPVMTETQTEAHDYHALRPRLRWLTARLLALSLGVAALAILAQIALAFTVGPLFFGTALFTAILMIPLVQATVLHPEITTSAEGLTLRPMLWQPRFIPWSALTGTTAHPLIFNDPGTGRLLHGKNYVPREGLVVFVDERAGLQAVYRLVGSLAARGNRPAFAISNTTHTDYNLLCGAIQAHVGESN